MLRRVLSAVVGVPLIVSLIWLGGPWLSVSVGLVALLAVREFYGLVPTLRPPLPVFGTLCTLLFIANASLGGPYTGSLIAATAVLSLTAILLLRSRDSAPSNWGWTLAGIFYIGWLLSHFPILRSGPDGLSWSLVVIFSAFATDTSAFFVGRAWGRRLLAPVISPKKTWEGAVGGFLGAVAAVWLLGWLLRLDLSLPQTLFLGSLVGILAQVGDITESLLKRRAGVKDASRLIPGHGGLLDRLDSILFSLVVVYYFSIWVG